MLNALRTNFRQISNVLSEGIDANGGYLVPEEYDSRLIDTMSEENIIRKLGHTITTSGEHKINIAGTKPAAAWIDEGGSLTFGDATFSQINLDAHKLHVAVKVTEELLYDNAFGLDSYLIDQFAKALSNAEEDAFLNGDGIGKPLGIFADKGGGEVAITTASATAITADEVINLVYSLKRPYRKNAKFIMNDQTIAVLRKLKDSNGAYLWQPSLQAGEPDRLFGYEVYTSPYVPTIAAGNRISGKELQQELINHASRKEDYNDIADEIFQLREMKQKNFTDTAVRDEQVKRINELNDFISQQDTELTEFDESLARRWLKEITVWSDRLSVELKSGVSIDIEG